MRTCGTSEDEESQRQGGSWVQWAERKEGVKDESGFCHELWVGTASLLIQALMEKDWN